MKPGSKSSLPAYCLSWLVELVRLGLDATAIASRRQCLSAQKRISQLPALGEALLDTAVPLTAGDLR